MRKHRIAPGASCRLLPLAAALALIPVFSLAQGIASEAQLKPVSVTESRAQLDPNLPNSTASKTARDLEEQNLWQDFCEGEGTDPYTVEAYEHWIVSNWLARELEERGEMITHDFLGLTIWGRATTGQQISADYVIEQIAKDLQ